MNNQVRINALYRPIEARILRVNYNFGEIENEGQSFHTSRNVILNHSLFVVFRSMFCQTEMACFGKHFPIYLYEQFRCAGMSIFRPRYHADNFGIAATIRHVKCTKLTRWSMQHHAWQEEGGGPHFDCRCSSLAALKVLNPPSKFHLAPP